MDQSDDLSTINDRLCELAQGAPRGGTPEGELWTRGRALGRRRRVASAGLALLLVVGVGSLAGLVIDRSRDSVAPADSDAVLALPDRLYTPSPWLDGTDDTGPIGPLVAMVDAERRVLFHGSTNGLVGVAASGDYAFLDLPDLLETDELFALSGDGRFLAYALSDSGLAANGVGVYDTVTGEIDRLPLDSEFGLRPQTLAWAGTDLVVDFWPFVARSTARSSSSSARNARPLVWDVARGDTTERAAVRRIRCEAQRPCRGLGWSALKDVRSSCWMRWGRPWPGRSSM